MSDTLFPDVEVQLSGQDGNAFFVIGKVAVALKQGGASKEDVRAFKNDALSGDYDHVIQTCMKWVTVL
jgi:hypothetical protein